jgi:hypothetical protein
MRSRIVSRPDAPVPGHRFGAAQLLGEADASPQLVQLGPPLTVRCVHHTAFLDAADPSESRRASPQRT